MVKFSGTARLKIGQKYFTVNTALANQLVQCFSDISVFSLLTAHQINEKREQG